MSSTMHAVPIPDHVLELVVTWLRDDLRATREAAASDADSDAGTFWPPLVAEDERRLARAEHELELTADADWLHEQLRSLLQDGLHWDDSADRRLGRWALDALESLPEPMTAAA